MRASTAYFVGAGSIVAAIAIGLGGGIVAGNIMHPIAPKQGPDTGKMAQRAEAATPATTSAPSERVQYLTGSQNFGTMIASPAEAQREAKPETKPDVQTTQASAEPAASPPPQTTAAVEPPKPVPAPSPQATKPVEQQASTEPASSPDNAYAKARDSDVKRAASERRRAERHERWAERRRYDTRDARGGRDQTDWDDVARNVRADSDTRDVVVRRPRGGLSLFGPDDD
jgi:outer membrane biosynthesis protein TonB